MRLSKTHAGLAAIVQSLLLASGKPLNQAALTELLANEQVEATDIACALQVLDEMLSGTALELKLLASGYRIQIRHDFSTYINRLWEERPQRYSRALLETLALVAYRQPVTRGEIEDVRGVAVGSQIIKTLQERDWIKVVGHKDVPGKPAMFATTKAFLDYFNLASLEQLPPLKEVRDLSSAFDRLQDNLLPAPSSTAAVTADGAQPEYSKPLRELSFSTLLSELEELEAGVKTDFQDMPEAEARS